MQKNRIENLANLESSDLELLLAYDINCRVSSSKLAKSFKVSRQKLDYRINKMQKDNLVLGFHASINPHKFGLKIYKLYLKLRGFSGDKTEIINFLKDSGAYWIGSCSGSYDLIVACCFKMDYEFYVFKNKVISKFSSLIVEERGDLLIDAIQFPKSYLGSSSIKYVEFGGEVSFPSLDEVDLDILKCLVENGRESVSKIANKLYVSKFLVKNRIKKLEELGVIIQYRLSLDVSKLKLQIYKAIITFTNYNEEHKKEMIEFLSRFNSVQYIIRNMWNIELEFAVKDYQEYAQILSEFQTKFSNIIKSYDTVLLTSDEWTPGFVSVLEREKEALKLK